MKIEVINVKSAVVKSACHVGNTMFVEFLNGNIYRADDVPVGHLDMLVSEPSAGSYFNKVMRKGYTWKRVVTAPKEGT